MNEKFKQLALKAKMGTADFDAGSYYVATPDRMQKFAESIVQECARIARATPCPYDDEELRQRLGHTWDMASLAAGQEIVTHFGVEQ
jgi:hypothetical protein